MQWIVLLLVLVPIVLQISCVGPAEASDPVTAAREFRTRNAHEILSTYAELLALPNVATDLGNIRRNAEWIRDALVARGAESRLLELPDVPPIVYGRLETPDADRTLGIYVHYDGQPVNPAKWAQSPWEPTLYTRALEDGGVPRAFPGPGDAIDPEWRIYGRAVGDDKAPIPALLAALDALREREIPLTSNLVFFFEGEEEIGSPHLAEYMEKHRDLLAVDAWLICDGPVHPSRRAQLMFGVRGYTGFELEVFGANRVLHSGHYGNWAPNPALLLSELLASMKDANGDVVIEGFYDTVTPLTEADRAAFATIPDYDDELRREFGLVATEKDNAPYMERILLPSLNVRGISSATVGSTARNIVPNRATASVDMRLVAGNEPEAMLDLVEHHIRKQGYHIVREEPDETTRLAHEKIARFTRRGGYPAARTPMDHPLVGPVIVATERAAGEKIVLLPTLGGSLPLYLFTDVLKAPTVIVPIANHDDNQHAPNENLRLANLWYGIELMASLLTME